MAGADEHRLAQLAVIRAKQRLIRCEMCEHFHQLEDCLEFQRLCHTRRDEFCRDKGICLICLKHHNYGACPDRGRRVCGRRGCSSLTHHELLHCEHLMPAPRTDWETVPDEEPVMHLNQAGRPIAGPSEIGLPRSLNDSGITESEDEEAEEGAAPSQSGNNQEKSLSEQAREREEALDRAIEHLEALRRGDVVMIDTPRVRLPPRAYEENCLLCKKGGRNRPKHDLGYCPQFLSFSLSERERLATKYACGLCLNVDHYVSSCPSSQRECGIYGCRIQHHPLLHRVQYLEPLSPEDDEVFNWPRHQHARQDGIETLNKCAVCQDQHDTRECPIWPIRGMDRINQAMQNWICMKCIRGEHGYCPAEQIVCGVNGCVQHHDPFFHPRTDQHWVRLNNNDSWGELLRLHQEWKERQEVCYQGYNLSARQERVRTVEQLGDQQKLVVRYGETLDQMPPYFIRRGPLGDIVMPEQTFRMLAEGFQHAGTMARELTVNTMRQFLLNMDKGMRQTLLAEEFDKLRDDPFRFRRVLRHPDETEESFAFRTARRQVAIDLWRPAAQEDARATDEQNERSTSESENSTPSGSETEESEPYRRPTNRLVLSGNPNEGNDSEGTPNT